MSKLVPPHNIEAEQNVLGAILLDNSVMPAAAGLPVDCFYKSDHKKIFSAMLDLHEMGSPIDPVTLSTRINGLSGVLNQCVVVTPTSANIDKHCCLLKEQYYKRLILNSLLILINNSLFIEEVSQITEKLEDLLKQLPGNKEKLSVSDDVRRYIDAEEAYISVTGCYKALLALRGVIDVTKRDKLRTAIRQVFHRLKGEGVIKPTKREGEYIRVIDQAEVINWWDASEEHLELELPLGVHRLAVLQQRNIAIIAGEKDSGKTAFCLDFVAKNMGKHPIHYFSSEMPPAELRKRLQKFDLPLEAWKKVDFRDRGVNFSDIIYPDDINVIDFLEINDNFYQIGQLIKDIYDKLQNGIAVIALQKNKGAALGRGGAFSMEKARLYVTLNHEITKDGQHRNWARIESGKNRVQDDINPAGLEIEYKLVKGCQFRAQDEWRLKGGSYA